MSERPPAGVVCQGPCRRRLPVGAFLAKDHRGRDRRRQLCHDCWARREIERRREEREKDIERAKTDNSPFGIARREVEASTRSPEHPDGVPMNDWYEHGLCHLHHLHYEIMVRVWQDRERRRRLRRAKAEERDRQERAGQTADREARAHERALAEARTMPEGLLDDEACST